MTIKGTSTLHDWESDVTQLQGSAQIKIQDRCPQFEQVALTIPVESIKSGKAAMDKNTYEALQEEKYPNIQFTLQDIKSLEPGKISATGKLSMTGTTQLVELSAEYNIPYPGQISLHGSHTMKMTDFGIAPPTAVFGTIKTGDEITIDYTLYLNKNN